MSPVLPAGQSRVEGAELLMILINESADRTLIPGGAVVGGADDPQQQTGVVALMPAGDLKRDPPTRWHRVQLRCMAPTLDRAQLMGRHLEDLFEEVFDEEVTDTAGYTWFVHQLDVSTGPSGHIDSSETFESLLFVTVAVSRDPISAPVA